MFLEPGGPMAKGGYSNIKDSTHIELSKLNRGQQNLKYPICEKNK